MWILLKDDGSIKYDGMNEGWERVWTLRLWECQQKGEERWTKQALIDPRSVGSQSASASPACFKYKQFCVHVMMPSLTFRKSSLTLIWCIADKRKLKITSPSEYTFNMMHYYYYKRRSNNGKRGTFVKRMLFITHPPLQHCPFKKPKTCWSERRTRSTIKCDRVKELIKCKGFQATVTILWKL